LGYKRADLRSNVQGKLDDAVVLFKSGRFSNAYYLLMLRSLPQRTADIN